MRFVPAAMATLLLSFRAVAAPLPSLPPLQCLDAHGRPSPDAIPVLRVDGKVTPPKLVHKELPPWPKGPVIQSSIVIELLVDRRGRVCAARLLKGSGPLAVPALETLKRWRFEPARINGRPIPVFYYMTLHFCPH